MKEFDWNWDIEEEERLFLEISSFNQLEIGDWVIDKENVEGVVLLKYYSSWVDTYVVHVAFWDKRKIYYGKECCRDLRKIIR